MKKHTYGITYNVKKNGSVWGMKVYIDADNSKEAKDIFKNLAGGQCVYDRSHHAFNVHAYVADKEPQLMRNVTENRYLHIREA